MTVVELVSGGARDLVRSGVLRGMRLSGGFSGRMLDPKMRVDPYPTYEWLRAEGRLEGTPFGQATAHHDLCDGILRHPAVRAASALRAQARSSGSPLMGWLFGMPDRPGVVDPVGPESMLGSDGAGHARLRKLTRGPFSASAIEALRPRLTSIAEELLAQARREPTFDLMSAYAGALPVTAICELLGIPTQDRELFARWGSDVAADLDALAPAHRQRAATRAMQQMEAYFTEFLPRRRANPGDDILSQLLAAQEEDRLSERELLVLACLLVLAGFETTVNLIGNGTMALIQHPDQLELLRRDPSLIPAAVEELLRYDAPVQVVARMASEDIEVAGTRVPANVMLSVMIGGANRDPAVFTDPDRLDVTRPNARKHLSFAAGPHHCLGASLARLEGEIAFTVLLTQLGDLQLAGKPRRRPTFVLRGYESVPLRSLT